MQRVIIVDVGNLRENRPGRARRERRTINNRPQTITFADWDYINEAITQLAVAAPGSMIYLIADKSMRYDFVNRGRGMRVFDRNGDLPCDNFWHMYVMPSRQEVARWRQDNDFESGVEADRLILYLAAELDGFVVSGDFFREAHYQPLLTKFGNRVFWPSKKLDDSGWCFASSNEVRALGASQRHAHMESLTQLESVISAAPILNSEEQRATKNAICEPSGLIDRFWLDYLADYDRQRGAIAPPQHLPPVTSPPSNSPAVITPPPPSKSSPKVQQPKPATTTSATRSFLQVVGEQLGVLPPTNDGVDEERKLPIIFVCHPLSLSSSEGSVVQLVGRVRSDTTSAYLEWYPGDKKVLLDKKFAIATQASGGFDGLTGRLWSQNGQFVLDSVGTTVSKRFRFEQVVEALSDGDFSGSTVTSRRWHLPRLPQRQREARMTVTSKDPYIPPKPKGPPPGRAVRSPSSVEEREDGLGIPPLPSPPRISSRSKMLFALAAATLAGIVSIVVTRF